MLSIGIVGLPNVGKSTLFNALLKKQQALVANYPFATIEPNIGVVPVPDSRLKELSKVIFSQSGINPPIREATVNFIDIAGLVKGASEGAGLGNKFLSHIREVNSIAHVLRAFEDPDIIREGSVSPKDDYETINTELLLADIETIEKQLENRKSDPTMRQALKKILKGLNDGFKAHEIELKEEEVEFTKNLFLLTDKPEIIVLNTSEDKYNHENLKGLIEQYSEALGLSEENFVVVSAKIEYELASLDPDEQKEYLKDLGLSDSGLTSLIRKAYEKLGLISFLTAGEKEVRAWTVRKGTSAKYASGEIHTDFVKNFIKAEVASFSDFTENGGWKGARERGKARLEGKEYGVKDGDVIEFKIGN